MSEAINEDLAQHHGLTHGVYMSPSGLGSWGEQRRLVKDGFLEGAHGLSSLTKLQHGNSQKQLITVLESNIWMNVKVTERKLFWFLKTFSHKIL